MDQIPGQMSLFDDGPNKSQITDIPKNYASPCGGCICNQCANEVNGRGNPGEMVEPCFKCEDCRNYDGDFTKRYNKKTTCRNFKITEYQVARNRKKIKLLQ